MGKNQCTTDYTAWNETNRAGREAVVAQARANGIKDFVIRDETLSGFANGKLGVGQTDSWLTNQINTYLNRYIDWKIDGEYVITGIDLGDEPQGKNLQYYAKTYKLLKAALEARGRGSVEVYACLLPAYGGTNLYTLDGSTATEANRYSAYRKYIRTFLQETGIKHFVVDAYPFMAKNGGLTKYFIEGYYATLQIVAEESKSAGAKFGFVMQALGSTEYHYEFRELNAAEMDLQFNSGIGFGADWLGMFRYRAYSDDATCENKYLVDSDCLTKNAIYDLTKAEIEQAQKFANVILSFTYNASALYGDSSASYYANYTAGFENDDFQIANVSFSGGMGLATELYDAKNGLYAYMFQNVLDTVYGTATSTVTATFEGYTHAAVIIDGEITYVDLENGVYTANLSNGQAVYVIPLV